MREPAKDKSRLEHILESIARIEKYVEGKTYDDFINDDMMYYAVVKNIEIIGEAANMLTSEFREAHPQTNWKVIVGMRNYLVHDYSQIDDIIAWEVVNQDLPLLKEQVTTYKEDMES